jgi:uncharacterized protein YyaL (SSP411 family)
MPNRLAHETSPYLLQHQNNPVDWHPWGPEAIEKAKAENKPIFLSIGYSACHWCHVMEHESFENDEIAGLVNQWFVPIKVDREERPDLDQIYMHAVQLMTGRGGWPMSVFLTPELKPFYGGTYWPPHDSRGMPGFDRILKAVHDAWENRREQAIAQAAELTRHIEAGETAEASGPSLGLELLQGAEVKLERTFDYTWGGFGGAPKFPHTMDLQLLLRLWKRRPRAAVLDMVKLSLDKMAAGGMYDQLGGGFARYSVDERWLIPHFEKMLYDNALLANVYLEAWQVTGEARYQTVVRETLDYILREMTDEQGGFHSAEDADSEGEEGKFYVWTPPQIEEVLGKEDADLFCWVYDVSESGNFEHGTSALNLPKTIKQCASLRGVDEGVLAKKLAECREKLLKVRNQRIRPGKDDKILVNWNALMIDAMANAGRALDEPRYTVAAVRAADFILKTMRNKEGRLLHSYRAGQAKFAAYLDDYAGMANALVSLHQATLDERWLAAAVEFAETMLKRFADSEGDAFFFTADDHEQLITRNKDLMDNAVPSGNSLAATALLRLSKLTGREDFAAAAQGCFLAAHGIIERAPNAAGQMLCALDWLLADGCELVLTGDLMSPDVVTARGELKAAWLPHDVMAYRGLEGVSTFQPLDPLFEGRPLTGREPTLYVCRGRTCEAPKVGLAAIREWLGSLKVSP